MSMPEAPITILSMSRRHSTKALIEEAEEAMPDECGNELCDSMWRSILLRKEKRGIWLFRKSAILV